MADSELFERAQAWLNEKWPDEKCPMCGVKNWEVADLVELRPYSGTSSFVLGGVHPLLPVVCTNCGNTVLVNAVVAGLLGAPRIAGR